MKKILETALNKYGKYGKDQLKLRLRGIGSGYKEGPNNKESEEKLHLCVSAKNLELYQIACQGVEKLLRKIYQEYLTFLKKTNSKKLKEFEQLEILNFQKTESQNQHLN